MKHWIFLLSLVLLGSLDVNAQTSAPATPPKAVTVVSRNPSVRDSNTVFRELGTLEIKRVDENRTGPPVKELIENVYRKPSKDEMSILAPSKTHLSKYDLFLKQPDTGILKLNSNSDCVEMPGVVVAKENCQQYKFPGAGTAYSFRTENYRIPWLADLVLAKNVLKTDGVLQQGLMVKLGDVALEDVSLQTNGMKYLAEFKPASDTKSLQSLDAKLSEGIKSDGFLYRLGFFVEDKTTFALRSIAYRGKMMRSIQGVSYNELDYDKRKDVIVTFRVIETEPNGNVTILWKMLSHADAPKIN